MPEYITDSQLEEASKCLKCISHPMRIKILNFLEDEPRTVSDIINFCGLPQSVTSDHLRLMSSKGILKSEKVGRNVYYSLVMRELVTILDCIRNNDFKH